MEKRNTPSSLNAKKIIGFDRGWIPEKIVSVIYSNQPTISSPPSSKGELMFLMKWVDIREAEFVPAKRANIARPEIVIQFYEDRILWNVPSKRR